jgi:hypothetical protein
MMTMTMMTMVVMVMMTMMMQVSIGGPDMDTLFITTAKHRLSEEERAQQPGKISTTPGQIVHFWTDCALLRNHHTHWLSRPPAIRVFKALRKNQQRDWWLVIGFHSV